MKTINLNIFNRQPTEKSLRKKIAKQYSSASKEFKIKNLELDKQFKNLSEEDYEYSLLKINHHPDSNDYKLYKLDLDKKYNKIDDYSYETQKLDINANKDSKEYKIAKVEIEFKYNKISENEKEKQLATIDNTPWFKFLETKLENESFSFKWDCNQQFLDAIAKMGYNQPDAEDNVMEWLKDCFIETFDEDIDGVKKDIADFEEAKTIKEQSKENPNIKIYS